MSHAPHGVSLFSSMTGVLKLLWLEEPPATFTKSQRTPTPPPLCHDIIHLVYSHITARPQHGSLKLDLFFACVKDTL